MCQDYTPHTPERTDLLNDLHHRCADLADAAGTSEAFGVDPTLTAVALAAESLCELTTPDLDADAEVAARDLERAAPPTLDSTPSRPCAAPPPKPEPWPPTRAKRWPPKPCSPTPTPTASTPCA